MISFVVYTDVCANTLLFHPIKLAKKIVAYIQTWYYFTQYSSDPWYLKLLVSLHQFLSVLSHFALQVAAVLISETCNQALITHTSKCNHPSPVYMYSSIPSLHICHHQLRGVGTCREHYLVSGFPFTKPSRSFLTRSLVVGNDFLLLTFTDLLHNQGLNLLQCMVHSLSLLLASSPYILGIHYTPCSMLPSNASLQAYVSTPL